MKEYEALRLQCAVSQRKGLHFILTSVLIWTIILVIHLSSLPIYSKNLFTFCASSLLVPIAFMISKLIKAQFSDKINPMNQLGFLLTMNQFLYLLIAMWVYAAQPEKLVMVLAIIFGAHLLPFGWLYASRSYYVFSVLVAFVMLIIGNLFEPYVVAMTMIGIEIAFSVSLSLEVKSMLAERITVE